MDSPAPKPQARAGWARISRHIREYWPQIRRETPISPENSGPLTHPKQPEHPWGILLGLPHPYVIPAPHVFEAQFYWDSYFTMQGLLADGLLELARGMVENFFYLAEHYDIVPNASATLWLGNNSQSPFLTTMTRQVFEREGDLDWLRRGLEACRHEYERWWMNDGHRAVEGLQRFHARDDSIFWSEAEAWDFTPRFGDVRHCVAVDLNALLYRYEKDFEDFHRLLGEDAEARHWAGRARERREAADRLLWDDRAGLYFDYDFVEQAPRPVASLAAYYPLWAGMASPAQARALVQALPRFEHDWGLASCDRDYAELPSLLEFEGEILPNARKQWNYPNGWPPLTWLAVQGLERYGYHAEARRIALKYLECVRRNFESSGQIWEKYNVVSGGLDTAGRYPMPPGFGWTNAVFQAFYLRYGLAENVCFGDNALSSPNKAG